MPPRAWAALPVAVWRRLRGDERVVPWLIPAAAAFLGREIRPDWRVLELGSGSSTVWLCTLAGRVTTIEHDAKWQDWVDQELGARGLTNCELRRTPVEEFPTVVRAQLDDSLDLVLVDGGEHEPGDRVLCVEAARTKVRPGGLLVLDDSDRSVYAPVDGLLDGWERRRFAGVRAYPLTASETSVFRRPEH